VPELPDLTIVAEAFQAALRGRRIESAVSHAPLAVRGTPAELAALVGRQVQAVRQRGKFLLVELDQDQLVFNPMLTGRFQLAAPGIKLPSKTALVLGFGARPASPAGTPPRGAKGNGRGGPKGQGGAGASWTRGASWLPADDASVEIRYRDPTQMGKVYLVPEGIERPIPGLDEALGPDADDPALTLAVWQERIRRHPGELKNLLKNQAFIAGIGNALVESLISGSVSMMSNTRSAAVSALDTICSIRVSVKTGRYSIPRYPWNANIVPAVAILWSNRSQPPTSHTVMPPRLISQCSDG